MDENWRLPDGHSAAALADGSDPSRLPRGIGRSAGESYVAEKFETRALVYDCFWHADGKRIIAVGPPPINLTVAFRDARYTAQPSGAILSIRYHASASVMVTELNGAPHDTTSVKLTFAGETYDLPVQPSAAETLKGSRIVFTMSRDNDLAWIREWAHYHVAMQGADSVVLFDNGSTRYDNAELVATLGNVSGLRYVAVPSWPYRYGAPDGRILTNPYYGLFLQVASMSVALRRYGALADGLLNCDIDELVTTPAGTTIFDLARQSPRGLVVMHGQFVEAMPTAGRDVRGERHRDYSLRLRDETRRLSKPLKWALDPTRQWVGNLGVHPYMHWIKGRPWFGKVEPPGAFYWHFRGINTNWKENRTDISGLDPASLEADPRLVEAFADPKFTAGT